MMADEMLTADAASSAPAPEERVPAGESLLRLGAFDEAEAARVSAYASAHGVSFDEAAVALALANRDEVGRAASSLAGVLALRETQRRPVSDEIVVVTDPVSPRAEAMRLLRTQVIAQHQRLGRRALAVIAPVDGVGCSFVAVNLAAAMSQAGVRTLIVDTNLRSPRVDQAFGLDPNADGLSTYLSLKANRPERVVTANVLPNLSVITAGPPVANPQELLSTARFREGVDILLREYDMAIFDTPPTSEFADALTIAGVVGYTLIVARSNHSYVRDVRALSAQLAAARSAVIGSVLNEF